MPCYHPLTAYRTSLGEILFHDSKKHDIVNQLTLPCRQCIGCRLERTRQWAMRVMHEASLHRQNTFATITYADEHLPAGGSLNHGDVQLFLKRLRHHAKTEVSFYMCGEYGRTNPRTGMKDGGLYRPHYHICLFNWRFPDEKYWTTRGENKTYKSAMLDQLWGKGNTETGTLTWDSAAYVTGYITQKLTGPMAKLYGERAPEYNKMSLRPAIGLRWLQKYKTDVYPHDYVIVNGKESKPPRYYDQLFQKNDPETWRKIALERELDAMDRAQDNTPERLRAKETVAKARQALKRKS